MSDIFSTVDQRTQLAGHNRLELLLFRIDDRQRFGINVFKVREVVRMPPLVRLPRVKKIVRGVTTIRGKTIPVLDLGLAVGRRSVREGGDNYVIVTEYNRSVQGFMVAGVDRIINLNWKDVKPPPRDTERSGYLTAVTEVDGELVEILDVERVLSDLSPMPVELDDATIEAGRQAGSTRTHVLIVDDSAVARSQVKRTMEQLGVEVTVARDGEEALGLLKTWRDTVDSPLSRLAVVVSDIEMPRMDGYTLTRRIREDESLRHLYVLLHTSLSGVFNQAMVDKVGADHFISKFDSEELARAVLEQAKALA